MFHSLRLETAQTKKLTLLGPTEAVCVSFPRWGAWPSLRHGAQTTNPFTSVLWREVSRYLQFGDGTWAILTRRSSRTNVASLPMPTPEGNTCLVPCQVERGPESMKLPYSTGSALYCYRAW